MSIHLGHAIEVASKFPSNKPDQFTECDLVLINA